ncbi:hypothetical protein D3C86_1519410 [compost metagenome]
MMPYLSFTALSTGTMALVVQEAAETILSSALMSPWLMPCTMFFSAPLPGAVSTTRAMPGQARCWLKPSASRHTPVLSTSSALSIPYWV